LNGLPGRCKSALTKGEIDLPITGGAKASSTIMLRTGGMSVTGTEQENERRAGRHNRLKREGPSMVPQW